MPRCPESPANSSSNKAKANCAGADMVVKEVVRTAIGKVFDKYFADTNTQQIEQWFNLGGTTKIEDSKSAAEIPRRTQRNSRSLRKTLAARLKTRRRA